MIERGRESQRRLTNRRSWGEAGRESVRVRETHMHLMFRVTKAGAMILTTTHMYRQTDRQTMWAGVGSWCMMRESVEIANMFRIYGIWRCLGENRVLHHTNLCTCGYVYTYIHTITLHTITSHYMLMRTCISDRSFWKSCKTRPPCDKDEHKEHDGPLLPSGYTYFSLIWR